MTPGAHFTECFNFKLDPSMDKEFHAQYTVGWNHLSIPQL